MTTTYRISIPDAHIPFKPRKDVKKPNWFAHANDVLSEENPLWGFQLERLVMLAVRSARSANSQHTVTLHSDVMAKAFKTRPSNIDAALMRIAELGMINIIEKIPSDQRGSASRARDAACDGSRDARVTPDGDRDIRAALAPRGGFVTAGRPAEDVGSTTARAREAPLPPQPAVGSSITAPQWHAEVPLPAAVADDDDLPATARPLDPVEAERLISALEAGSRRDAAQAPITAQSHASAAAPPSASGVAAVPARPVAENRRAGVDENRPAPAAENRPLVGDDTRDTSGGALAPAAEAAPAAPRPRIRMPRVADLARLDIPVRPLPPLPVPGTKTVSAPAAAASAALAVEGSAAIELAVDEERREEEAQEEPRDEVVPDQRRGALVATSPVEVSALLGRIVPERPAAKEPAPVPAEGPANALATPDPAVVIPEVIDALPEPVGIERGTPRFVGACNAAMLAYRTSYALRYRAYPVWTAARDRDIEALVEQLGLEAAPILEFYLAHPKRFYHERVHVLRIALDDAPALRTQWATQKTITAASAAKAEADALNRGSIEQALSLCERPPQ